MARYRCEVCDYVYDEGAGAPREGFAAGTAWSDVPDDWACPDCGVREKLDFVPDDGAADAAAGGAAAGGAAAGQGAAGGGAGGEGAAGGAAGGEGAAGGAAGGDVGGG